MKSSSILKVLGLCLAAATTVTADPLNWTSQLSGDPYGTPLKFLKDYSSSYMSYTGMFDLTTSGFNASTMTITSATASFAFADDSPNYSNGYETDPNEYVDVFINNLTLMDDQEVDGSHPSSNFAWYGSSLNATMLLALQDDGMVSFKVQLQNTSGTNDVYLKVAKLYATGFQNPVNPPPTSVPEDGTTMAFLGLALVGLAALRKRLR